MKTVIKTSTLNTPKVYNLSIKKMKISNFKWFFFFTISKSIKMIHDYLKKIGTFCGSFDWHFAESLSLLFCKTKPQKNVRHFLRDREYVYSIAVYQNEVGRIDTFQALARNFVISPNRFDIFDIRQHQVRILFTF